MNKIVVKKIINNKLKIYRTSVVGTIGLSLGAGAIACAATLYTLANISSHSTSFLSVLVGIAAQAAVTGLVIIKTTPDYNYDKIDALKKLKKELKKGKNPFNDVKAENFDEEFKNILSNLF